MSCRLEKYKVSVIMGIYNCENTLAESIDSIINQTYKNIELIMCDDCSKDNTYNIAKKYELLYPEKIKVIKNDQNITLGPTLNRCLELATGEFIARQDGDDISVKDRIEKQVNFLLKNKEFDLVGTSMLVFNDKEVKGIRGSNKVIPNKIDLVFDVPFCHATILANSNVYKELNGYNIKKYTTRCEDVDLWFRFFSRGFKGYNLSEALYKVRDDNDAYKRRTFKNYFNLLLTNLNGFRLLNIPFLYYIFLMKPIISAITPKRIMQYYHKRALN